MVRERTRIAIDNAIVKLQTDLKELLYYKDTVDGDFGNNTYKAVVAFQKDYNLTPDGAAGKNTRLAIARAMKGEKPHKVTPPKDKEITTSKAVVVVNDKVFSNIKMEKGVPYINFDEAVNALGARYTYSSGKNNNSPNGKTPGYWVQYINDDKEVVSKFYAEKDLVDGKDDPYISIEQLAKDLGIGRITTVKTADGTKGIFVDSKKTDARDMISMSLGFIPGLGDAKDFQEGVTGYDIITGKKLTAGDRVISLACTFMPVVNGKAVSVFKKGFAEVDSVAEQFLKVNDVEKEAFKKEIWGMNHFDRGELIEAVLAKSDYTEAKGWYQIGRENNGFFPAIDFQNGKNVVSVKSIDPSGYKGNRATKEMMDQLEELKKAKIEIEGKKVELKDRTLDIRVRKGMADKIDINELRKKADGVKIILKEF